MIQGTVFEFKLDDSVNGVVECEVTRPHQSAYVKNTKCIDGVLKIDIYNDTDLDRSLLYGVPGGLYSFRFRRSGSKEWSEAIEIYVK